MLKIRLLIFMIFASLIIISCSGGGRYSPPYIPSDGISDSLNDGINKKLNKKGISQ